MTRPVRALTTETDPLKRFVTYGERTSRLIARAWALRPKPHRNVNLHDDNIESGSCLAIGSGRTR